jgi:hypothetical protein
MLTNVLTNQPNKGQPYEKTISISNRCSSFAFSPLVAHAANGKTTVEYAKFTLKEGVTDTQMIAASQKFEEGFLVKQSGYIKRDLLHLKGREWADIVYWASREEAEKVLKACEKSPVCGEYFLNYGAI